MIRTWLLASTSLVAFCSPAQADPIFTPLLTALFTSLGVSAVPLIAGSTISLASIAAGLAVMAIGIGLSMLFAPKPPKPTNGIVPVQMTIPYRIFGYGTDRLSGALMFKEESAGTLGYVAAFNSHEVSAFRGLYLDDDLVSVPIAGGLINGAVSAGADGRYGGSVISIDTRKGTSSQTAYANIVSRFSPDWDTAFRGDGIASIAMICSPVAAKNFATTYPYGAPKPSAIIDQAIVFDPRDPAQDVDDRSTWQFSDNAALCYLHFRCFSPFGSMKPYSTAVLPRLSRWIEAINVCDERRPLKAGGDEAAYRVAVWMTTEQDRKTCEQSLRACFDGWSVDLGDGSIDIEAGKYYEPDVIITDADIVAWSGQRGVLTKDRVNRITARYKSPDNGYQLVTTDAIEDVADQARRPGPKKSVEMDLSGVPATGQASRLQKRESIRQKAPRRGTLVLWLSGLNAAYARRIRVQSNTVRGLGNTVVEVSRPIISLMTGTVTINYLVVGAEIDDYDKDIDESAAPPVPTRPSSVGTPIPADVNVSDQQISDGSGSVSIVLVVSWDIPMNGAEEITTLSYVVQYRIADIGGGVPGDWVQQSFSNPTLGGGRASVQTAPVPAGQILEVEVGAVGGFGSQSGMSSPVTVDTTITTSAPGTPTSFVATGGAGSAALTCTNPNSPNFYAVQFYRAAHGAGFGSASPIGGLRYGVPNGATNYTDTVTAGTYDYWASSENSSGVSSSPAGPQTATVT